MSTLSDRFLAALRAADRRQAFALLDGALDAGATLDMIYLDVIQPALREVGRLWQLNEMTVAEEHAATAIAQAAQNRAFERVHHWRDTETPRVVAACAGEERHHVGLKMLCDLLELDGWSAQFLGPAVPVEDLLGYILTQEPKAVALSATIAPHLPRVREVIEGIRAAPIGPSMVIGVGGRAFLNDPTLASRIGADFTASDAMLAVRAFNARVRRT